jgi:superfamily II DNA or RNA helicase
MAEKQSISAGAMFAAPMKEDDEGEGAPRWHRHDGCPSRSPLMAISATLPANFEALVSAAAAGAARKAELAVLEANPAAWASTLRRLLSETDQELVRVRRLTTPEREQVVADFEGERRSLAAALACLTGETIPAPPTANGRTAAPRSEAARVPDDPEAEAEGGPARLQLSWDAGRLVAWAASRDTAPLPSAEVLALLVGAGAPSVGWEPRSPLTLPDGTRAEALTAALPAVLGWLVGLGGSSGDHALGASARWWGHIAAWAAELVAQGRMVPALHQPTRRSGGAATTCSVRWRPVLVDPSRLAALAASAPGAVMPTDPGPARPFTERLLSAIVDVICTNAAGRLEVPAAPPRPHGATEVAEAFLGHLDGAPFDLPTRAAAELASRLERWARPTTRASAVGLAIHIDAPDRGDAWQLRVTVSGSNPIPAPAAMALAAAPPALRREIDEQLARVERLLPALGRAPDHRRGEVILSQDEAWELMTETGRKLVSAGFEVNVPLISRRHPTPALRLTADASRPSGAGAQQLAQVRWSAVFDDVELTAADIAELAAQARPMVEARGRWVALDHADLAAAAAALAERSTTTELTGAAMLRQALGLEGSPLAGGVIVDGNGWASDLLRQAAAVSGAPAEAPPHFKGTLRSYQAEALAWLGFLDDAGLGGCLALDMGLGKTPTVLARVLASRSSQPVLVVAPPAVVGNWAAEAARFTPDLRVVVHHGSSRSGAEELGGLAAGADVVLTTYGTAVRDVDALETIPWDRVVIDEAQAIKNPASETAQQLRRIPARSRLALTGTPIENGLGDLWSILDFTNPGLVGPRPEFINHLSGSDEGARVPAEAALRALNGLLVFRRTKAEPAIAAELPERIDELDHCVMTPEQIGLYQAVLDRLVAGDADGRHSQGEILAAITALKQICNHPAAYRADDGTLADRSGKLARLEEIVDAVFAAGERVLIFTHFAQWGQQLAAYLSERSGIAIACYDGGLRRQARDRLVADFQTGTGPGALVLSLKAGGTGLNLTAASHVVLYDRWWNPAVEDQARDRAWRIGQTRTVVCHRLVCPGTVDERVEEIVAGKRRIADLVLPKSSSLADLDADQLRAALGLRPDTLLAEDIKTPSDGEAAA